MADQVLLLVLGFVLTTVVGGVLGFYYQQRTWDKNRRESERAAAASVFDEISRAMDERLYRMRLVYWGIKRGDEDRLEAAIGEYRVTLVKWNDNLNRNLALAYRYFGRDVWKFLSEVLYEEFAIIGRHLEDWYRSRRDDLRLSPGDTARLYVSGRRLQGLSDDIYDLNRFIISMIQRGVVGVYLVEGRTGSSRTRREQGESAPWDKDLFKDSKGALVVDWQRKLNRAHALGLIQVLRGPLDVDGWFGQETRNATIAFQRAHGLKDDGAVGAATRRKMNERLLQEDQESSRRRRGLIEPGGDTLRY
jgi:peptidoglycan hydrolase-like protein with peptidoglycan-binding domain